MSVNVKLTCQLHQKYTGRLMPRAHCDVCLAIFDALHGGHRISGRMLKAERLEEKEPANAG